MKRFEMRVDPLTHEIYYAIPLGRGDKQMVAYTFHAVTRATT